MGLVLIVIVASVAGLLFGYDTGVINGTQFYFSKYLYLDAAMKGWVVGSALLGCLMGAAFSGIFSNNIGRKNSLILSALLFTVSAYGLRTAWVFASVSLPFSDIQDHRGARNRYCLHECSYLYR